MLDTLRRDWRGILLQSVVQAVVLVLLLVAVTYALGNKQVNALEDIKAATRAQVCVLTLPIDPKTGRDPIAVERCLTENGF